LDQEDSLSPLNSRDPFMQKLLAVSYNLSISSPVYSSVGETGNEIETYERNVEEIWRDVVKSVFSEADTSHEQLASMAGIYDRSGIYSKF
jgi:hypothetical protein